MIKWIISRNYILTRLKNIGEGYFNKIEETGEITEIISRKSENSNT